MFRSRLILGILLILMLLLAACGTPTADVQPTEAEVVEPTSPPPTEVEEPTSEPQEPEEPEGEVSLADYFAGGGLTVDFYPKPWPLENLVTPGKLTIVTTAQNPPMEFINPDTGELDGSRIEFGKMLANDLGLEPEFVVIDWAGVLPGFAANQFDIALGNAGWREERLASHDFLMARPSNVGAVIFVVRKDSGIATSADISGKRLGGVKGQADFEEGKAAVPDASEYVEVAGKTEAILALINGQVDAFVIDIFSATSLIQDSPQGDELTIIGPPAKLVLEGMIVNYNEPDLLKAVDVLLTNYISDGTFGELEKEYLGTDEHVKLLEAFGY